MNKENQVSMTYTNKENITQKMNDPQFKDFRWIVQRSFKQNQNKLNVPLRVGTTAYDLAK
jgi:hypothetical protein